MVRKLEQRGIAGVCIEDKQFPKTNSFLNGERQPLADIEEFAGKIAAGKDTQQDANFSIVARVEALIAGWGMDEALRAPRPTASPVRTPFSFTANCRRPTRSSPSRENGRGRLPLVIVPTRYYSTPDRCVSPGGHQHRDLGQSPGALGGLRNAKRGEGDFPKPELGQRGGAHRLRGRDLSPAGCGRVLRRRAGVSVEFGFRARAVVLAASRGRGFEALTAIAPR
jgi:hypothetical protein